jgi:hypothetical protein
MFDCMDCHECNGVTVTRLFNQPKNAVAFFVWGPDGVTAWDEYPFRNGFGY